MIDVDDWLCRYLFHNFDLFRASDWTMVKHLDLQQNFPYSHQVVLFLFAAALTIVCDRLPDATAGVFTLILIPNLCDA
jgi:hypothetical protein